MHGGYCLLLGAIPMLNRWLWPSHRGERMRSPRARSGEVVSSGLLGWGTQNKSGYGSAQMCWVVSLLKWWLRSINFMMQIVWRLFALFCSMRGSNHLLSLSNFSSMFHFGISFLISLCSTTREGWSGWSPPKCVRRCYVLGSSPKTQWTFVLDLERILCSS